MGCMGSGPARCKKCARGYRLKGAKCLGKGIYLSTILLCHFISVASPNSS